MGGLGTQTRQAAGLPYRVVTLLFWFLPPDEGDINPKVLQLLGSEKIQVYPCVRPPPRPTYHV